MEKLNGTLSSLIMTDLAMLSSLLKLGGVNVLVLDWLKMTDWLIPPLDSGTCDCLN